MTLPRVPSLSAYAAAFAEGALTPARAIDLVLARIAAGDPAAWIAVRDRDDLAAEAAALGTQDGRPLWGVPFAVKDNIDVAGLPTTAACPEFAFTPERDATVVARLRAAGAIPIGKTNLDQFATGLVGIRSPYGAPRSVFDADYVSGGSSSGSAVAVASGQVPFSLGTDTAGSGRVPAGFNNIVGVKPSLGLLPTTGVLPACRTLDCVSVFATTVADATLVRRVAEGFDGADAYSRTGAQRPLPAGPLRVGVLAGEDRVFFGDAGAEAAYDAAIARLAAAGHRPVAIDYRPFRETAEALYGGPWVAERLAAIEPFFRTHGPAMDPTVHAILSGALGLSAADAFRGLYRLAELRRRTEPEWAKMDVLLLPTSPTTYRVEEVRADPIRLNANLGLYTNFANLLDCCSVAVPAGFRDNGLPVGVMLVAPAFHDDALARLADGLHRAGGFGPGLDRGGSLGLAAEEAPPAAVRGAAAGPGPARLPIVVVGAHLSGEPLNGDLVARGGVLERACRTAPDYRLYALAGTRPEKPGLVRVPGFAGPGIAVELWSLPAEAFGPFVAAIPAPLGIGKITLEDGSEAPGFLCEPGGLAAAREITDYGGWRAFRAAG
jgi:allophanate hydrolase